MEFIELFETSTSQFSKKIKGSKYIEGFQKVVEKGVNDICELIIGNNEIEYESCEKIQKTSFINTKKLEIASQVEKNDKYSKNFRVSLIQAGLQGNNLFSSILYLNEYYKINCIIYNQDTNKFYRTTLKNYNPLYCIYKHDSWFTTTDAIMNKNEEFSDITDLKTIITMDYDDIYIFRPYLQPLSKYKVKDLEEEASKHDISLINNGKKKIKKQLYDDINLKHFCQDI